MMYGQAKVAISGGEEGKTYASIIKSRLSKKEIIEKTTNFMAQYEWVEKENIHLDQINERISEYSIPFCFPQTQFYEGMRPMSPIVINGKLRFEFHEGGVLIVAQSMDSRLFVPLYSDNDAAKNKDAAQQYDQERILLTMSKTAVGKALIWANTTDDERKDVYKAINNYFSEAHKRVNVYRTLLKSGDAELMSREDILGYCLREEAHAATFIRNWLEKAAIPEYRMIELSEKRWEKQVRRQNFDRLFIVLANELNGEIVGINEDGNTTWNLKEGILLPENPKDQKKYLKGEASFYSIQ